MSGSYRPPARLLAEAADAALAPRPALPVERCSCGGNLYEGQGVRWCVGSGRPVRPGAEADFKRGCGGVWFRTWGGAWRPLKASAA